MKRRAGTEANPKEVGKEGEVVSVVALNSRFPHCQRRADAVRQDRSSGNLSRSGRVELWEGGRGRSEQVGKTAREIERSIAAVKSLLLRSMR